MMPGQQAQGCIVADTNDLNPQLLLDRYLSFGVFPSFYITSISFCAMVVGCGRFCRTWDPSTQKILPPLRTLTYEADRTLEHWHAQIMEPLRQKPLVVNVVVVGLLEEEKEGIGIADDIVQAMGQRSIDPGSLGGKGRGGMSAIHFVDMCPLARLWGSSWPVTPQYQFNKAFNKTKLHTQFQARA